MSGVLVALGAAVAKTAFKMWTGDNALADNVSDELTDLIAGKVSDARDRQKVANRFASIAEIVGDRIAETMREEFRSLDEGEKNAAVIAVTETLGRADLSDIHEASRAVVAARLDAATLDRSMRRFSRDTTRYLSADGTAFYELVLSQCCASIVEIADKLPGFQADAFAMLLSNDRTILDRIGEVLARLPMPSRDAADRDQVEVDYRRVVAKDFDRLELFGLDFAAQWYPLSIAYVNLTMSARQPTGSGPGPSGLTAGADPGIGERTLEHWLDACPRLLIEGRAGGGKTTLLQWVAVRAALRNFTGTAAAYNEHVPFYIRLRAYVGRALPRPDEFLDSAAPALAPEAGTWPSKRLRGGKAFVLVDGIDEIPERQRPEVLTWLEQLAATFPESRYVVTTRPGAIEPGALARAAFVSADLEPMSRSLVRVFVSRWHDAMRGFQHDTAALDRLAECHADLLRTLEDDRFLTELANTPLLAGLICALNHYLDGQLPRRRSEIYEEALRMFYKRDRKREITQDLSLDLDATNHLLSDLALWMARNAQTEVADSDADDGGPGNAAGSLVTTDSARQVLRQSALSLPKRPPADADLYRHLLLRSGVLREPTAGHVDFVHRTFQEYLAAKALVRTESINELIKNAADDQWREIVILASGLCSTTRQATGLLRGLIKPGWRGKQRYSRRLLAVACLEEVRHVDPAVLKQIEDAIPELLPPRDMAQAEALSHAGGDRLIPHLAAISVNCTQDQLPPVVRAAALTGGPRALDMLGLLALRDGNQEVPRLPDRLENEYMLAWDYFDPEQYIEAVIAPLKVKVVALAGPRLLKAIGRAPSVREVTLTGLDRIEDLSPLRATAIDTLDIIGGTLTTLDGIAQQLPSLKYLGLNAWSDLIDISGISQLPVVELRTDSCPRFDPAVAQPNPYLRRLVFRNTPVPVSWVSSFCPGLTDLRIERTREVDLSSLAGRRIRISITGVDNVTFPAVRDGHPVVHQDGSQRWPSAR